MTEHMCLYIINRKSEGVKMDYVQNSIFDKTLHKSPLADRVRPRTLHEYVGQEHIIGNGKILRNIIQSDNVSSMILCGSPWGW